MDTDGSKTSINIWHPWPEVCSLNCWILEWAVFPDDSLQEIVVKDAEVVGILAALVTTITVAGFTIAQRELDKYYWFRLISFLSFVFSLISLMTASRLLLSINKLHPRNVLQCLESLDDVWGAVDAFWWFNRSLQFLLISAALSIYVLLDALSFAICAAISLLPFCMMWYLHKAHTSVVWPMINIKDSQCSDETSERSFKDPWFQRRCFDPDPKVWFGSLARNKER